jgi:hypothetical protein
MVCGRITVQASERDASMSASDQTAVIEVGQKLANGATVVAVKQVSTGDFVVLASWLDEYVTWRATDSTNTYWGHYFSDLVPAVKDFESR